MRGSQSANTVDDDRMSTLRLLRVGYLQFSQCLCLPSDSDVDSRLSLGEGDILDQETEQLFW